MQQKLCLWMAMVVLFGALCVGNPFLACRDGTSPVEPTTAAAPSTDRIDPAVATRAAPQPSERDGAVSARAPKATLASDRVTLANDLARMQRGPAEAAIELASLTPRQREASAESECPDADLRPLVARTERHDGVLVWVLHDGRRFRRNPKPAAGEPLLVPFVVVVADDRPE